LLICLLSMVLVQEEPVTVPLMGTVFLKSGEQIDLVDFQLKGPEPYEFMLTQRGESEFVSLYRITKIEQKHDSRDYAVVLETGESLEGRIGTISFTGTNPASPHDRITVNLRRVDRVHVISGDAIRSCSHCGYEAKTPHPF